MTTEEKLGFQQRCRERWQRARSSLNWAYGSRAVWVPVLTEQQKQERDEYVKKHSCPF